MSGSKIPRASGATTPSRVGAPVTPGLDKGPQTKNLDKGPQTSGLDGGAQTPGLDSNPLKSFLPTESGESRQIFRQPDDQLFARPRVRPPAQAEASHSSGRNLKARSLDQHVTVLDLSSGGTLSESTIDDYYLCWRMGLFVGKFAFDATLPPSGHTPDTSELTHINFV